MKIDWNRIKRTAIQSASGAGIALITAIVGNFSAESIVNALVQFVSTVAVAVLMNLKAQTEEE